MSRPGISKALETIEVSPRPNDGVLAPDADHDGVLVGRHLAEELQQHDLLFDRLDDAEDRPGEVLLGAHEVRGSGDDEPVAALHPRLLGERDRERVQQGRVPAVDRLDLTREQRHGVDHGASPRPGR